MQLSRMFSRTLGAVILSGAISSSSAAAPMSVLSGFDLLGFDDIEVNGELWDVRFSSTDTFYLYTTAESLDFATALLPMFTTNFNLAFYDVGTTAVNGCSTSSIFNYCDIMTPHVREGLLFEGYGVRNGFSPDEDLLWLLQGAPSVSDAATVATWTRASDGFNPGTPVPEPGTAILLGLGLAGLAGRGSRRLHAI